MNGPVMSEILVPVSFGELLDKIAILQIKSERMSDPAKLENVRNELSALEKTWMAHPAAGKDIARLRADLKAVNERLWVIEDDIRIKEKAQASTTSSSVWRAACTSRTTSARASRRKSTSRWARPTSRRSRTRTTRRAARRKARPLQAVIPANAG